MLSRAGCAGKEETVQLVWEGARVRRSEEALVSKGSELDGCFAVESIWIVAGPFRLRGTCASLALRNLKAREARERSRGR